MFFTRHSFVMTSQHSEIAGGLSIKKADYMKLLWRGGRGPENPQIVLLNLCMIPDVTFDRNLV